MNSASPETTAPASPAAVTMEAFFTRQRANEGIEFPLDYPDGTPSPHRIRIRGIDSDAFKLAKADSARRLMELMANREKAKIDEVDHDQEQRKLLSTLVIGWTFNEPCTPENVVKLLREAPQLAEQIDRIAGRRHHFFPKGSPNSTPSLPTSSS